MAQIGIFTRGDDGAFIGTIRTIAINVKATIKPVVPMVAMWFLVRQEHRGGSRGAHSLSPQGGIPCPQRAAARGVKQAGEAGRVSPARHT
jgi:hypothetical protein